MNTPYIKQLDKYGITINPIEKPIINMFPNRKARRNTIFRGTKHPKNNKSGIRLIVTNIGNGKFIKTYIIPQLIGNKRIQHYHLNS